MTERMTRKELTERVRELENSKIDELYELRIEIKNLKRQMAVLIKFLGLEYKYIEGHYEFIKKKVPAKILN